MKKIAEYWRQLWFARFDPLNVGVFRISLGILITVMFFANYFNWERFYALDGIISLRDRPTVLQDSWCAFVWTEDLFPIKVYWWVGVISALAFTLGFFTRLATIILYVLQTSMIHRNLMICNGDDLMFRMLLLYGMFAPLGHSLSIDSWLKSKKKNNVGDESPDQLPMIWAIRLMQINVLCVYIFSIPYKIFGDTVWLDGTAIYWTITSNVWSRGTIPGLGSAIGMILIKIATYGSLIIEATFPFLVWFERTRIYSILALALLHLGIAVFIPNVAFFTFAMICSFWIFVPSNVIRRWREG